MDSSPEAVETATDSPDVSSAPSTENQGVGSLLDAVNASLNDPEAAPASDEPGSKEPEPEKPEGEAETISEEEMRNYSKGAQRRIRELVEARKSVEGQIAPLQQELETIKPKAERLDQLTGYMRQHEISPEHLDNALGLTAMINGGDYQRALPILENLLNQVRAAAGDVLPQDLQQQVNLGYITEAHAKELNRARTSEKNLRERTERERAKAEEERNSRDTQAMVTATVGETEAWDREQAASDPDWNLKRDLVAQRVEVEVSRRMREQGPAGYPRTKADVRAMLDTAKKEVEKTLKRFSPAPKPIDPPVVGNGASPRSRAKPGNLMDAVNQALAGE